MFLAIYNQDKLSFWVGYYASTAALVEKVGIPIVGLVVLYTVGVLLQTLGHVTCFTMTAVIAKYLNLGKYFYSDVVNGVLEPAPLRNKAHKSIKLC
ncbi:hypothetical protein N480_19390 [Pseudoalteromonas luteoviolacea S2607]|uniref:hypothetical protein n=1 Tax=Pseudoalteromonas luteoviolacea TaxID=43657 RepID=UPI0007B0890A|nr:hypothetical protein [Pseudoalteromonas luteoviolacea]KZN35210.1 hypothetical protein N480_19390 [Pseudoalteromonas luteoviolacea S2607]